MEGFLLLKMINKKGIPEDIALNTNHIVYIRRYKTNPKVPFGNTAIFTKTKMIVVEEKLKMSTI